MTIEHLLNTLRADRDRIDATIKALEPYIQTEQTAQRMLSHLKKRKKPHWASTPEGRKRLARIAKKKWAEKRRQEAA